MEEPPLTPEEIAMKAAEDEAAAAAEAKKIADKEEDAAMKLLGESKYNRWKKQKKQKEAKAAAAKETKVNLPRPTKEKLPPGVDHRVVRGTKYTATVFQKVLF